MNWSSEKALEREFCKVIEGEIGGLCIKLLSTISGLPDRLVLLSAGRAFFVEFKSTGQKPRKLQGWWKDRLEALGFKVYIVYDKQTFNLALYEMARR